MKGTIKLTGRNATYGASVPSQRSLRANFGGAENGTGWHKGDSRFQVKVTIAEIGLTCNMTVGDTTMLWQRHQPQPSVDFNKVYEYAATKIDQEISVEVEKL